MPDRKPIVLVIEQDQSLADELRRQLETHGYRVAGPFASNKGGLAYLGGARADAAVLDLHLKDGLANPLAGRLARLGIPFCVVSGFKRPPDPEYASAKWIEKPHKEEELVDAVWHCLHVPP